MYFIGLDIGSISVNAVLMSDAGEVLEEHYLRTSGQPLQTVYSAYTDLLARTPLSAIGGIAVTGSGGQPVADLLGGCLINEVVAHSKGVARLHPEVRTVVEMGGEDAKILFLSSEPATGAVTLKDLAINTVCAAGTGSFLDQQASRLGVSIEEEFGRLALQSQHPPRIAGRCSVFAKSDMIHLQQAATPVHDIIMGLCLALARNIKSHLARGRDLEPPVSFQGGVAANRGMVRAIEQVFALAPGALFVPRYHASLGAIGAVLCLLESTAAPVCRDPEALGRHLQSPSHSVRCLAPLEDDCYPIVVEPLPVSGQLPVDAYLGVDVGSISTNLVVLDRARRVIARRYLMTAGQPIEAVRRGLQEIGAEIGDKVVIRGVATTGSGRYLTGDFIGADQVKNEITAHARGAAGINPAVDTIFEIGGQDSKYIRLENGAVVDFAMNKVCAAGTGSFLEEQAERLGISIKEQFGALALSARAPVDLGDRCTVFMESSLNHYQQQGVPREDLVGGLSYSIVQNYLSRVVEERPVGDVIFFQGGTAYNRGIKAAFEKVCGKKITVPPHHDVLGAVGCALIALEHNPDGPSRFKGFELANRSYTIQSFECRDCANRCEIRKVSIAGEKALFYGSRCGKFDEQHKDDAARPDLPDLFAEREQLLCAAYRPGQAVRSRGITVGLPRATLFFELYPFWNAFLAELGCTVVLSSPTSQQTINDGCEAMAEEICFPIKVAHGHILDLLRQKVDCLLLPAIVNQEPVSPEARVSYNCLLVQSLPFLARAAFDGNIHQTRLLSPVIHFEWGRSCYAKELRGLARSLGCGSARQTDRAIDAGLSALQRFRAALARRGSEVLRGLGDRQPAFVVVSRTYNGCDPGVNLRLPDKLQKLGVLALPLDFLPVAEDVGEPMQGMYWRSGQRMLSGAHCIERDPRLHAIYITNFSCGPDSFIMKHIQREMRGKPWLLIELDEHSADAGVVTRLEAFYDSLFSPSARMPRIPAASRMPAPARNGGTPSTVYIPYMDDHGLALAAAMRYYGINGQALPLTDEASLALGRRYTSGRECYPCIITTGDILKKALSPDFDPERDGFFMASAMGPCRFGQYRQFHRMVLDDLGLHAVPLVVLDQTTQYEGCLRRLGPNFRKLGWQALVLVDYLKKMLLQTRPYEARPGASDALYAECLGLICDSLERNGSVRGCAAHIARLFAAVPTLSDGARKRPLIGIVGEIFVRSNSFSNNSIVRTIEALGGEAVVPPLLEWVRYTDWERRKDLRRERAWGACAREVATGLVQQLCVQQIRAPFAGLASHFFREASTQHVMDLSGPYLSEHIRGEAALSLGRAVEYARHGCHGLVNLTPFNCLPGIIVNSLLGRFSKDYPGVPVLKMVYDGSSRAGDQLRIEAFVHQAKQALDGTTNRP